LVAAFGIYHVPLNHLLSAQILRRYREAGCTLITTAVDATAITRDTGAQLSLARAGVP